MNKRCVTGFITVVLIVVSSIVPFSLTVKGVTTALTGKVLMADDGTGQKKPTDSDEDETGDNDMLIIVLAIILVIWIGISAYLFKIDRKLTRLEREIHEE